VTVNGSLSLPDTFTTRGLTRYGASFAVTPTWTVDKGTLDAFGGFTAPTEAGPMTVTAHLGQVAAPLTIDVIGGDPVGITVTPDPLEIGVGLTATMEADVTDQWGNVLQVAPTWSADVGEIDPVTGVFTAPLSLGQGKITATYQTLIGHADVTIRPHTIYLPLMMRN
jgi:hypothetical protein